MPDPMAEARALLQHHFGYREFRPAQVGVLRSILAQRDTLAVLPTGGGKSLCFQIPALVFGGLTVVVSPLIALMQDQVSAALARGIPAAGLHSALRPQEQEGIWAGLRAGAVRLLYVSPERLARLSLQLREAGIRPVLLAVDEAHCIAEWGHDFRPSYRVLRASRYRLGRPPTIALTGSATPEVRRDIVQSLGFASGRYSVHLGSFDRPNLWFGVVRVGSERERLAALRRLLAGDDAMAIVYAPTRRVSEGIARALVHTGFRAAPYHAGLTKAQRAATLTAFLDDRVDVVVATCAFGMGIDKPDVRQVVHWTLPATPEAYYQEAGRAGRDGEPARCVLLWRPGDDDLHRRQLDVTFPPVDLVERLWREGERVPGVPGNVRESAERLRRELAPERGAVDWRAVRVRRRRAAGRIDAMERYAVGGTCRRQALLAYFGERLDHCSGCDRCRGRRVAAPADPAVTARFNRLRAALVRGKTAWGGSVLEPEVLLALARHPPLDVAALADAPGVGPAVAECYGPAILRALGVGAGPQGVATTENPSPLWSALDRWRGRMARQMGVPAFVVMRDSVLRALASRDLVDGRTLDRVPGLGPRARAKLLPDLVAIVGEARGEGGRPA